MQFFISAIGTDSGKTLISALLTHVLQADYWKPIQAGYPKDSQFVEAHGWSKGSCWPEQYGLDYPESPHSSAEKMGVEIKLDAFSLPFSSSLIVEGAGGLLVPLNAQHTMVDLLQYLNLPLILVCDYYLGSINHTLLSLEFCQKESLPVAGLLMNGKKEPGTHAIITRHSPYPILAEVPCFEQVSRESLSAWAQKEGPALRAKLQKLANSPKDA